MRSDSLFDRVRRIPTRDAAEAAGLHLKPRGGHYWARCPLHGEDTASLCVYADDRGWYCFGCHKGGDAVKLYEFLYNLPPIDAAKQLARNFGIDAGKPDAPIRVEGKAYDLERAVNRWYGKRYFAICEAQSRARADAVRIAGTLGRASWDSDDFKRAVAAIGLADQALDEMERARADGMKAVIALYKQYAEVRNDTK